MYLCIKLFEEKLMSKTFNFYCDESTHLPNDKHPYMLLGYVSVAYPQTRDVSRDIRTIMTKYDFRGEIKWTNVHDATLKMYQEIIDYFFRTDIKFRTIVVPKKHIEVNELSSYNSYYYKMYYKLLHHKINQEYNYNIYLDIKDTCSHTKLNELKEMLSWSSSVRKCQFINSRESVLLQLTDLLMGAINYNLRVEIGDLPGTSVAKMKLVDKIKNHENISVRKEDNSTPYIISLK